MNKCPNCGESAVSAVDKLFRNNRLECQNCGRKLQVPHYANILLGIALLMAMFTIFTLNLDRRVQISLAVGVMILLVIVYLLLPLELKQNIY